MQRAPDPTLDGAVVAEPAADEPSRRAEWAAFALCAVAAVAPLWSAKYLPMIDLPQHAAQIAIWQHLDDRAWGFSEQFELNWFTPYLLGYLLARAVAAVASVPVALKVVLSLYVVALPLSIRLLLSRAGGERWWALVGFPLAYGASFYWGLLNYLVALPAGIAFVAVGWQYADAPSTRRGVGLALMGVLLFYAHALVLGAAILVVALLVAARAGGMRTFLVRALPLAVPLAGALAWMTWTRGREARVDHPILWVLGLKRLLDLPAQLLGFPMDWPHPANREAVAGVGALVAAAAVGVGGVARERWRLLPGLAAIALYALLPRAVFGASMVNERFSVLIIPFALVAAVPAASRRRRLAGRALIVAIVLAWSALLVDRFRSFDAEAVAFDAVVAPIPPDRAVLGLLFDATSAPAPGFPYLHFPAWYQAERGGRLGYSFAGLFPYLVRYRPGMAPSTTRDGIVWDPESFDPVVDAAQFEYFIARDELDLRREIFPFDAVPPELIAHEGLWWLYRRAGPAAR